jgi:hypothetical protein
MRDQRPQAAGSLPSADLLWAAGSGVSCSHSGDHVDYIA